MKQQIIKTPFADHNYVRELLQIDRQGIFQPGELVMINVAHDDWCGIFADKKCNCEPEIRDQATGQILNGLNAKAEKTV